ncbi:MAG: hypothetical protein LWW87_06410 [Geobacteraceae bacterium]|nr:hypothetical protein [Geobacteraceae bacterium]
MDVSSIAGAATLMQSSQTQQALSASMIKMNAESQSKIAEMIQKGAQSMPQPTQSSVSGFSTYA